jgi:hypothetical protein
MLLDAARGGLRALRIDRLQDRDLAPRTLSAAELPHEAFLSETPRDSIERPMLWRPPASPPRLRRRPPLSSPRRRRIPMTAAVNGPPREIGLAWAVLRALPPLFGCFGSPPPTDKGEETRALTRYNSQRNPHQTPPNPTKPITSEFAKAPQNQSVSAIRTADRQGLIVSLTT